LYDASNEKKRTISEGLLLQQPIISSQVVSEYLNVSRRLLKLPKQVVFDKCIGVFGYCIIAPVVYETLLLGRKLMEKYDFQLFDSIIIATALQTDCGILYSEDLQSNQLIEGKLIIKNPFSNL
jgi:predicted nucleic acid-binding protein